MKRRFMAAVLLLSFGSAFRAGGASVLWDRGFALVYKNGYHAWDLKWTNEFEDGRLYPDVLLEATHDSGAGTTEIRSNGLVTLGYGYNWVSLRPGDIVDASSTRNQDAYFLLGWIDWNSGDPVDDIGRTDYSVTVTADGATPFYLGFATQYDPELVNSLDPLPTIYGWVELFADGDQLLLGHTAIDFSGAPLVVGQIPEPSSACLAAMGAAMLLGQAKAGRQSPAKGEIARR